MTDIMQCCIHLALRPYIDLEYMLASLSMCMRKPTQGSGQGKGVM